MAESKEDLREFVYNYLLEQQGSACAICDTKVMRQKFVIDHDHKSGKIRGLLCNNCNLGLGYFQDNTVMMESAINYLKTRSTRVPDRNRDDISNHSVRSLNQLDLYDLQFHSVSHGKYANNRTLDMIDKYTDGKHDEVQVVCKN